MVASDREALSLAEKIVSKYVRKGEPMARSVLEKVKAGGYAVFEITPGFFTSWDYGKLVAQSPGLRDAIIS